MIIKGKNIIVIVSDKVNSLSVRVINILLLLLLLI